MVKVIGVRIAAGDREDAGAQNIGELMDNMRRAAVVRDRPASVSINPSRRSALASSNTPPWEVSRPPSNAAVIFLRQIAGKENGRKLSSRMAGVAASDSRRG